MFSPYSAGRPRNEKNPFATNCLGPIFYIDGKNFCFCIFRMVERVLSKADEIGSKLAVGKSILAVSTFFTEADPDLNGIILPHPNPREPQIVKNNFPLHPD